MLRVTLCSTVDRHSQCLQFPVGRLQLLNASELPRHVVQARLYGTGRVAGSQLKECEIVMGLAEAEEHRPPLQVLMGHFQSQRPRVKIPRSGGVTDLQDDVTEPAGLNHYFPPGAKARLLKATSVMITESCDLTWRK